MILRDWLEMNNLTAYKVAKTLQISHSTLYKSMNGEGRLSYKLAVLIESYTNGQVSRGEAVWPELKL